MSGLIENTYNIIKSKKLNYNRAIITLNQAISKKIKEIEELTRTLKSTQLINLKQSKEIKALKNKLGE